MHLQFPRHRVSRHHPPGDAIDGDQFQHVAPGEQPHLAQLHLPHQRLIGAVQQLLSGLAAGVEGATHQGPPEAAGGQAAAVFAGERHPLGDALVNDAAADFRQPLAAGFPGPEVAAFQGVGEQAADAVAIHGRGPGCIDAALGRHRVRAPRAVVEAQHRHPIPLLRQGRRG